MRKVELGIFMPVGSNGFLMSKAAPRYHPTFELHSGIARIAEDMGLDYLFSMGKWMGFPGESGFWQNTIEPMSMASAVSSVTSKIKLYSTINPLLFHPAVAAKIIATIDNISGGRFGINIVTGNTLDEIEQMGLVPEGYGNYRYEYADEWISVMKALWSQEKTDWDGRFFKLKGCVSDPKPLSKPFPAIVSAGISDEGLAFGAKHSDYQFVGGGGAEVAKVKTFAADLGRTLKTSGNVMIVVGDTDEEAMARFGALRDARDEKAFEQLIYSFERDNRESYGSRTSYLRNPNVIGFGNGTPVIGSPDTVAAKMAQMYLETGLDALQMTFVDFIGDLKGFGAKVYPKLKAILAAETVKLGA